MTSHLIDKHTVRNPVVSRRYKGFESRRICSFYERSRSVSNNGYVAPHLKGPEIASTANLYAKSGVRNSARVHLNENVARRILKGREFIWWDMELHGFGLRSFPSGKKCWFVQLRQRGKQKRITLGHPGDMTADQVRAAARAELAKAALDGLPAASKSAHTKTR